MINKKGDWVIKPDYWTIRPFSDGLAIAQRSGLWGFIDMNETWPAEYMPAFESVRPFARGLAVVVRDGKWGIINRDGNLTTFPRWNNIKPLTEDEPDPDEEDEVEKEDQ